MDCNRCENVIKNVCNPKGTKKPKIYFVTDCPSKSESESGISFSGEYSVRFHSMIDSYGLDENNCRFGYCVRCFPLLQNNDDYMNVLEQLFKDCKNILFDDIKSTNPSVIVALGTKATSLIVSNTESKAESADNYNINIDGKEYKLISIYHPKYVVENQRVLPKFYEKLSEVLSLCTTSSEQKSSGILNENSSNTIEIYNYRDFDAFCKKYIDGFNTVGYDIETNALEVHHINYKVVGFSLASSKDVGCYVVLESIDFIMNPQDHKMIEDRLRDILLHKKIIVYNCMHELPATLNWLDIEIPDYEDLLIMVKLMMGNADAYVGNGGLKAQSVMHLHTMDWSKDLDEYASVLKSYKNNYEESEIKLRIILGKYYDGDMLDVIVRKSLYYAENVVPNSPEFSYGFVPCKLIARYGSIDSSILFELKEFYENWMTKEGKELGIDLFQGYKYWKWHHYAGYCLERNGAFWNDEKAKKIEKWCEDGKIECLRNIIKSPLMYKWILTTTEDEYCKYLYENYCDEMIDQTKFAIVKRYARGIGVKPLSTLAETELKQKSITPTKQGIYKLETQHILYMGREFVKSKSELRDKWTKEFIENIDNKSFDELKKVVNPGSTLPEFRDYLASVLITPITKVAKFYDNIAVMVDDPEFNIGNFVSNNKNSSDDIKVVSMIYKFKSSDVPISDRFDWFQSFITSESRVYKNYKIRKAKEDAINYTFVNLDSKTFNTIYNLYLMCHIDVEDRSTWNKEFEWMYNYKMFKKYSKLLSTYIEGTVARANVYEVDKKSFSNGDILTRRERKYSKEHPIGDDKQYLMQTKFKVNMANTGRWTCFTGDTKIKSLDGNSYTFEELINNGIDKFWVYSIDGNNNIVPALAFNPHITDYVNEIIKITLDSGECIKCTPNHLFLMRDGNYKKASDIVKDDSLMPLYLRESKLGYLQFKNINTNHYNNVHTMVNNEINSNQKLNVIEHIDTSLNKKQTVLITHHKDFNKKNNSPDNLVWMTNMEHSQYHSMLSKNLSRGAYSAKRIEYLVSEKHREQARNQRISYNKSEKARNISRQVADKYLNSVEGRQASSVRMTEMNKSEWHRNISSQNLKKLWNNKEYRERKAVISRNQRIEYNKSDIGRKNSSENFKKLSNTEGFHEKGDRAKILKVFNKMLKDDVEINEINYNKYRNKHGILWENLIKKYDINELIEDSKTYNHSVAKVEIIKLDKCIPVYDITVDKYHNFALDCGVFVHNCGMHNLPASDAIKGIFTSRFEGGCIAMPDGCLVGSTKVRLANGNSPEIKDLVGLDKFYVYSYDVSTNKYVIAKGHSCREVKKVNELYKITFNNGKSVICTTDHKFFSNNVMDMVESNQLKVGDSISHLDIRRKDDGLGKEREYVIHPDGKSEFTYLLADKYNVEQSLYDDVVYELGFINRHHIDFNADNNSPDNITRITPQEHGRIHGTEIWKDREYRERMVEKAKKQWTDTDFRNLMLNVSNTSGADSLRKCNYDSKCIELRRVGNRKHYNDKFFETLYDMINNHNIPIRNILISGERQYDNNVRSIYGRCIKGSGIRTILSQNISLYQYLCDNINDLLDDESTDCESVIEDLSFINSIQQNGDKKEIGLLYNIYRKCDEYCRNNYLILNEQNFYDIQCKIGLTSHRRTNDIVNKYFGNFNGLVKYAKDNHYITSIELLEVENEPVYCFQVDTYHNYYLDCGVLSSNSQMEVRTLAAESKDEALLQAFSDGVDIHRFFASKIYSVPYEDVQKWQRGLAKNAVFGMLYGESEQTFANSYLGGDLSKAKEVYNGLFTGFPKIKDYIERKHNQYLEKKKVTTLTQRFINLDSTKEDPDRVLRQSQNFPIQASAEDIAGCILYKLCEWLKDNNMKSKPFCFIHDSIEIDMHPDEVFKILEKLDYLFNVYPREEFGVPVACDVPLSMSMGAEIDVADLKCNSDYMDIIITLDGYKDDIEELIDNWKKVYKVCEQVIDYVPDEEDKKVYMPIAERFLPQKAPVSMKQGTYRNHIKRQFHIIVR